MPTIVKKAPSSIAVTGGTDVTFSLATPPTGSQFSEANYSSTTYREREKIIVFGKEPIPQNGVFQKATRRISVQFPRDLNEVYHLNALKLEYLVQPETTDLDIKFQIDCMIQLMISGKYRSFLETGVLPE